MPTKWDRETKEKAVRLVIDHRGATRRSGRRSPRSQFGLE